MFKMRIRDDERVIPCCMDARVAFVVREGGVDGELAIHQIKNRAIRSVVSNKGIGESEILSGT